MSLEHNMTGIEILALTVSIEMMLSLFIAWYGDITLFTVKF